MATKKTANTKAYMPPDVGPNWWRDIPEYGGKYQASRDGKIRRVYPSGLVKNMTPYKKAGAKAKKIHRNRQFVKLTKDGKGRAVPMLWIMANTWHTQPPGTVAYHINGIVTDNRAENIGFTDRSSLGKKTGHMSCKRRPVFKVNQAGEDVEVYGSAREAAAKNYMSYQAVLDRCHGKIKNPYALDGYTYRFEDE